MNVDVGLILLILKKSRRFYLRWELPKKSGGTRTILQPNRSLRAIQAWILRNILDQLNPAGEATAYIKGGGIRANVEPHATHRYFFLMDLEDFFPSIRVHRVTYVFLTAGYSSSVANMLGALCTCTGSLPQGGVTSPALSNLTCIRLDNRIAGAASRRNLAYTRYADDITLSANTPRALRRIEPLIREIVRSEGFRVNAMKTRFAGPRVSTRITGLTRNSSDPGFGIGKRKKIEMRAIMHRIAHNGVPDNRYPNEASIEGWLSYLMSVDPASHCKMSLYWKNLKRKAAT